MRKALRDGIVREATAAKAIADAAIADNGRALTDVERDTIDAHMKSANDLRTQGEAEDALHAQMTSITAGLDLGAGDGDTTLRPEPKAAAKALKERQEAKAKGTIGQQFVNSDEFKAMMNSVPNGRFGEKARVHSQPFGTKSLITGVSDTSAGALVLNDQRGFLDSYYERPLTLRSLFASGQTDSDTIEYVRVNTVTNNAAPVAEATESGVIDGTDITAVEGGLKPESGMTLVRATAPIRTIAHWMPITKRALADAPFISSLIDSFLRYGLEEELEDQLMTGSGSGENLTGLANTSGLQTQAAPAGSQTVLDTTRIARRKVRIGGRAIPTAFAMNPLDWESIELMKDANNVYYGGGPFNLTTPRLWGLPVVESEAVPQGTAYCADWRYGMVIDREEASVQVSDSHADFFTRNLVAILAEMRAGFAVFRPSAFVKITLA